MLKGMLTYAVCKGCQVDKKNDKECKTFKKKIKNKLDAREQSVDGTSESCPLQERGLEGPTAYPAQAERPAKRRKSDGAAGRAAGAHAHEPSRRFEHFAQPPLVSCENVPEEDIAYDVREEDVEMLSSAQNGGGSGGGHRTLGLSGALAGEVRGLWSKTGIREGGIAGSSGLLPLLREGGMAGSPIGDGARAESVEKEGLVLASSGRGESRDSRAGAGGAQVGTGGGEREIITY
jgi:hypothetical protein